MLLPGPHHFTAGAQQAVSLHKHKPKLILLPLQLPISASNTTCVHQSYAHYMTQHCCDTGRYSPSQPRLGACNDSLWLPGRPVLALVLTACFAGRHAVHRGMTQSGRCAHAGDHAAGKHEEHMAGCLHSRGCAAQASLHHPVLAPLPQPQEAHLGWFFKAPGRSGFTPPMRLGLCHTVKQSTCRRNQSFSTRLAASTLFCTVGLSSNSSLGRTQLGISCEAGAALCGRS